MFLIVGLGNPGSQYEATRHNIGFLFIDELAAQLQALPAQSRFQGLVQKANWGTVSLQLLKPLTFMNLSGRSVRECATFFKIPAENIIVIFDDLDQAPGAVRMRFGGGHGGHNGMRSLMAELGTDKFHRIKVGIGKPEHKSATTGWVLGKLTPEETAQLNESFATVRERITSIIKG